MEQVINNNKILIYLLEKEKEEKIIYTSNIYIELLQLTAHRLA
jgi:hypothetical protein